MSVLRDIAPLLVSSLFWGCGVGRDVVLGDLPFLDAALGTDGSTHDGTSPSDATGPDATGPDATGEDAAFCQPGQTVSAATRAFLNDAIGFGRFATGGAAGCVYRVTTMADSGPGSLREGAEQDAPLWIVFDMSGTIELASAIAFGSNKTVDGREVKVTIRNFGFTISAGDSNVVVENLTFIGNAMGSNNDAFQIADGAHTIWIDHCSMSNYGDGLVDITHGATDVTVSWSVFAMHDAAVLIGRSILDRDEDVNIRVTLHNNWWNQTETYAPRLRFGKAHVFNNFIDRWASAASAVTMSGEIYSEKNIYNALNDKKAVAISAGSDDAPGRAKTIENWYRNGALADEYEPDLVFQPLASYMYKADVADMALETKITTEAGAR